MGVIVQIKSSYCHSCIRDDVELRLEKVNDRVHWLCEKCANPLPEKAYSLRTKDQRKHWGEEKWNNKGTSKS